MKKFSKLSFLLVLTLLASLFTGCTMDEKSLADAFLKNQEILSLESITNLDFKLTSEGLSEDEQIIFDGIADVVNDLSIEMQQRSVANEDQTSAKAYGLAKVNLGEESHDTSIWVDLDMSGDELILKEIFKLPTILKDMMPEEIGAKKYMVLDFNDMMKELEDLGQDVEATMDMNEVMAVAMKYQEKFVEAINNYIRDYDSKLSLVKRMEDKSINGEMAKIYQVKFDDASFKEFLKYNMINVLQDKEMLSLFTDYMAEVFAISGEEMPEEFNFQKDIPQAIEKIKEMFETIDKVSILGKDGIVINYGINEDGYIISEEGKYDFLIDVKSIMEIASEELEGQSLETMSTPVFNLVLSSDMKVSKINKDMIIYIPKTTSQNSISYMEAIEKMLENMMPEMDMEPQTFIFVGEDFLELSSNPLLRNNIMFVPSRDIGDALGAQVEWNEKTKEITVTKDGSVLVFELDSNEVIKNGEKILLQAEIKVIDGVGFVPLRFISESLGYEVEWDPAGFIDIYKN